MQSVQKVKHRTGGHHCPLDLDRLRSQCLVPVCPAVMLNRVTSRTWLRTRGVGPLAQQLSAALRSFDIWSLAVGKPGLSCRSRNWGFEKTADHPWWERHCGQGLVRWAEEPRAARLRKGAGDVKQTEHFRLAQCVTKRNASTSGAGVPVEVSGIRRAWQGCPAHPRASERGQANRREIRDS